MFGARYSVFNAYVGVLSVISVQCFFFVNREEWQEHSLKMQIKSGA